MQIRKIKAIVRNVKPCELCGISILASRKRKFCPACSDIAKNIYLRDSRMRNRNMI